MPCAAAEIACTPEPAARVIDGGVIADGYDAELDELRAAADRTPGTFLVELEEREKERDRHSQPARRVQQRPRLLHRGHQLARGEDARRLPPPPDAEERRALHHARAEGLRGQGAVGARPRARAGEVAVRGAASISQPHIPERCRRSPRALAQLDVLSAFRADGCEANYVPADVRRRTSCSRSRAGATRWSRRRSSISSPTTAASSPTRRLLLITGPNMGGKSTYMRQVALIVLMAHVGAFVPARAARIGPIDQIFTRIGAADDLAGGRSTFMVEMTESAAILHNATDDEPGADGRGRARHLDLRRPGARLGDRAAPDREKPVADPVRDALLRADAARARAQARSPTCTSTRSSTRTASCSCTRSRKARRARATACRSPALAGVPKPVIRRARKYLQMLEDASLTRGNQDDLFLQKNRMKMLSRAADRRCAKSWRRSTPTRSRRARRLELLYRLKKL